MDSSTNNRLVSALKLANCSNNPSDSGNKGSTTAEFSAKLFENRRGRIDEEPPQIQPEWLNSKQAAEYLGLSQGSLMNLVSNGHIPVYKLGRRNRYLLNELRSLLLANKRGGSK